MAKGKSSSSSSGTRKKHAAKKAVALVNEVGEQGQLPLPEQKEKKKKKSRFEPKVKVYVPPPPPPKGLPDPVDLYMNGGKGTDPEFVVTLRKLMKKDEATLCKGVEAFEQSVRLAIDDKEDDWMLEQKREEIIQSMAVWAHHFPRLALHPSRRLRAIVHSFHVLLVNKPGTESYLLQSTRETLLAPLWIEQESYIGSWFVSTFDTDRLIKRIAKEGWDAAAIPIIEHIEPITQFTTELVLTSSVADSEEADLSIVQAISSLSYIIASFPQSANIEFVNEEKAWEGLTSNTIMLKEATFAMLQTISSLEQDLLQDILPLVSEKIFRSCWTLDAGWSGTLAFLKRYPQAWRLADEIFNAEIDNAEPNDKGDSDVDEAQIDQLGEPEVKEVEEHSRESRSPTISLLYRHLKRACTGKPRNYPVILPLFSLIPSNVLPPTKAAFDQFFQSLWAALKICELSFQGGRSRSSISDFGIAYFECLGFAIRKLQQSQDVGVEEFATSWVRKGWEKYLGITPEADSKRKTRGDDVRMDSPEVATAFVTMLERIDNKSVFKVVRASAMLAETRKSLIPLAEALNIMQKFNVLSTFGADLATEAVNKAAKATLEDADDALLGDRLEFIMLMVDTIPPQDSLDQLVREYIPTILTTPVHQKLVIEFIARQLSIATSNVRDTLWRGLFSSSISWESVLALIGLVSSGRIALPISNAQIDEMVLDLVKSGESLSKDQVSVISVLSTNPEPFISHETSEKVISRVLDDLLQSPNSSTMSILLAYLQVPQNVDRVASNAAVSFAVFQASRTSDAASLAAWELLLKNGSYDMRLQTLEMLQEELLSSLTPILDIVKSATSLDPKAILSLAPKEEYLTDLSKQYAPTPLLSILDPLVPQESENDNPAGATFDIDGLSPYTRLVSALICLCAQHPRWLVENNWALKHFLFLVHAVKDELALPGSVPFAFSDTNRELLRDLGNASEGMAHYALSLVTNDISSAWHEATISTIRKNGAAEDGLTRLTIELIKEGKESSGVYSRRTLQVVLGAVFRSSEDVQKDAKRWLAWVQSLPEGSRILPALLTTIKQYLLEDPRFARYQNELASMVAGVSPSDANGKGVKVINALLASAPALDSDSIFLPQQRSVFVIQNIKGWITSDVDLDDQVHSLVTELFIHLAPIVQDLSGSHWELMFDLLESNFESTSWDEPETWIAMYASCRLLSTIIDLAASNAELRSTTKKAIDDCLKRVVQLYISRPVSSLPNTPRDIVVESLSKLLPHVSSRHFESETAFIHLIPLLKEASLKTAISTYAVASRLIREHVTDLIVKVELDTEDTINVELPSELVAIIQNPLDGSLLSNPDEYPNAIPFLLGWLVVFEFFNSASPRLKAGYIEQLRNLDLVSKSLLPSIFTLVTLTERVRSFDVSLWSIDEFFLEYFLDLNPTAISVLGAHVFYKGLQNIPSLIRFWWEGCKDKQLHQSVANFTSKNCSPILIASELAHLKDPNDPISKILRDNDDFTVRVLSNVNEVKAVYVVDEQNMEIGIRIPPEYPLYGVEVKDVKRVGVSEAQWRAWLLAVQQVISTQSGLIADALTLFKRNVSLHFEGVEACAICYSVISVVDRTLPNKECKTCHNRFHAGCLFKWFSTSHGSSCPLCRSLF